MLFVFVVALPSASQEPSSKDSLKVFEPLMGQWQSRSPGGSTYTESWKWHPCGYLEGSAVMKNKDGKTLLTETLRIQQVGSFTVYIACVNKNPPVLFTLTESKDTRVWKFVNEEHDFPQHIIYRLESADLLIATAEGNQKGKWVKDTFRLKKVKPQKGRCGRLSFWGYLLSENRLVRPSH